MALVCKGHSSLALLDSYNEERLPVIAQMLNISTALSDRARQSQHNDKSAWDRGGPLSQLGVNYRGCSFLVDERKAGENDGHKDVKVDSYTIDGFVRAGDRAPDAPGLSGRSGPSRLFDIFKPYRHTVLLFATGQDVDKIKSVIQLLKRNPSGTALSVVLYPKGAAYGNNLSDVGADMVLEDQNGHAFEGYGVLKDTSNGEGLTVVAVRPDGLIGAIAYGLEGIDKYFKIIFAGV